MSGITVEGISGESGELRRREDGVMTLGPLTGNKICFTQVIELEGRGAKVGGKIRYRVGLGDRDSDMQECLFSLPVNI